MSIGQDNGGAAVKALKTPTQANQEAAIMVLEKALAMAKDGKLASVAIAVVFSNRVSVMPIWSSCDHAPTLAGAVAVLQHDLLASISIVTRQGS